MTSRTKDESKRWKILFLVVSVSLTAFFSLIVALIETRSTAQVQSDISRLSASLHISGTLYEKRLATYSTLYAELMELRNVVSTFEIPGNVQKFSKVAEVTKRISAKAESERLIMSEELYVDIKVTLQRSWDLRLKDNQSGIKTDVMTGINNIVLKMKKELHIPELSDFSHLSDK